MRSVAYPPNQENDQPDAVEKDQKYTEPKDERPSILHLWVYNLLTIRHPLNGALRLLCFNGRPLSRRRRGGPAAGLAQQYLFAGERRRKPSTDTAPPKK